MSKPDQQHAQSILEAVAAGLQPTMPLMTAQELVGTACCLARLQYYDGPLLRSIMRSALLKASSFTHHHVGGLLWALGR